MSALGITIILAMVLAAGVFLLFTIINNISVCPPSEVLIFSGRTRRLADGRLVGYRVIRGGRAMRIPLIETKDRMQLTNMAIELSVTNAFSRGGIPLKVHAVANVKLPSEESLLHNAIERFLGASREGIMRVAKDTLEGNLRGVIAELTPEEINQQKMIFQQKLIEEADKDLHRLGLLLDNLQIQNISDDVSYLSSVGRVRSARIKKEARIAELQAWASAAVQKAHNQMNAEISKIDTDTQVAQKENQRRIVEAQTKREAVISEVRGQVQAQLTEAKAQLRAWEARAEQVRRKLEADVISSAQATKSKAEADAKANAASIVAEGRAAAAALVSLSQAYQAGGRSARESLLLQKLLPVFSELTGTMKAIKVDRLTLLGGASGGSGGGTPLGAQVVAVNEQVRAATGVDLVSTVQRAVLRSAQPHTPSPPTGK
ncbi:MAG TPA: SPFH domain-containing protein [Pseudomonadota bacterium]|nr:SPFH domain-containing protein [Pseudomonadota bacterium]HNN50255.1 SPFH domain-containing protein [Pseudomonadota bacterium]